jgi:hypothetical protein
VAFTTFRKGVAACIAWVVMFLSAKEARAAAGIYLVSAMRTFQSLLSILALLVLTSCASSAPDPGPECLSEIAAIERLLITGSDAPCVTEATATVRRLLPEVDLVERPEDADAILLLSVSVLRSEGFAAAETGCEPCRASRGEAARPMIERRVAAGDLLVPDGAGSYRQLLRLEAGEGEATPIGRRLGEQFVRTVVRARSSQGPAAGSTSSPEDERPQRH